MAMSMKPLLLVTIGLLNILPFEVMGAKTPHFLFAGQSNMIGAFDNMMTYTRFNKTMQILLSRQNEYTIYTNLLNHLVTAPSNPATPSTAYQYEANELIRLKREGYITRSLQQPLSNVTCTYYKMFNNINYRLPTTGALLMADAVVNPYGRSGETYGPEIMFGHVMYKSSATDGALFRIIKIAAAGTSIKAHWSKNDGTLWPEVAEGITDSLDPVTEEWKGIVWFQGEDDSFNYAQAQNYLTELTKLIADLRQALFQTSTSSFAQPSDIPVIIVGLGCWIASSGSIGATVMNAQRSFVQNAKNAVLVPTHDLSCNNHFDEGSMLIIGERIAKAYLANFYSVLKSSRPTKRPTLPPNVVRTNAPVPAPTSRPTNVPTVVRIPTWKPNKKNMHFRNIS
ncbi:carbohydrate esterase [Fragilaria crotonensis]|nr:carbohydrate esterase [Fragilaria crotonensis]